jgi:hypothetical protein
MTQCNPETNDGLFLLLMTLLVKNINDDDIQIFSSLLSTVDCGVMETELCLVLHVIKKKGFVGRIGGDLCDWMQTGWVRT